jgi:hypothetical protein
MKLLSLVFISLFMMASVEANDSYQEFKTIITTSISYRNEVVSRQKEIELLTKKSHILTGQELESINIMAMERFNQQNVSMNFINAHAGVTNKKVSKAYEPTQEELKSIMMALALGVTMADNYLMAYQVFENNTKLRKILNEYDIAYDKKVNMLRDNIHEYYSLKNRKRLKRAIKIYQTFFLPVISEYNSPEFVELSNIIEGSPFFQKFKQRNFWSNLGDFFNHLGSKAFHFKMYALDIGAKLIEKIIYDGSKIFGNTLGTVHFRPGKLQWEDDFLPSVQKELQVLDVLMENTPNHATSKYIPGFWTHAAIYAGTEEDLKFYGIWDHPFVQKHQERIRAGANVIEGLRSGVEINPIKSFKDADTFAAIRLKQKLSYEETKAHLLRAFAQVGKVYDFSFDIQSGKQIVCSELHYITFTGIHFNTSRILGRQTISIDQIAEQALTNRYFNVITFWLDGEKMVEDVAMRYDITLLTEGRTILSEPERIYFSQIYDLEKGEIKARKRANPAFVPPAYLPQGSAKASIQVEVGP